MKPNQQVYGLCANWVWGKLQYNNKEDPNKVTGWKLAQNTLSIQKTDPQLISYRQYYQQHLKPNKKQQQELLLNLSKGPAAKAKNQIQKNIKNITVPKTLIEALKQSPDANFLIKKYLEDGKYQILPAFYKLVLSLKKAKRQFAIVLKNSNPNDNHDFIIDQLNLFFNGQHPLYNGKNGTPLVKMDGSKGTKNYILGTSHQQVQYALNQNQVFATFGSAIMVPQQNGDPQMFKQRLKSKKQLKFCQGISQIFAYSHTILAESACIYEINTHNILIVDPVDYHTQQIYFTNTNKTQCYSCLSQKISPQTYTIEISIFQLLRDVDYFIKKVEKCQLDRVQEIQKRQKGQQPGQEQQQPIEEINQQKQRQSNSEYLKKNLLPILEGALRQVDIFRPSDPIGFIALYCLKTKQKLQS